MNQHINALLGPLEAATRSGSWEDAEDIAGEIRRLAKLQRLSELQKIQEALIGKQGYIKLKHPVRCPQIAPRGSQMAKTPLPVTSQTPVKQGDSTPVGAEPWRKLNFMDNPKTVPGPFCEEQWPFG